MMKYRYDCRDLAAVCLTGVFLATGQFSGAAPTVTRLTPPSVLFSANNANPPITARFLPGQRFDLQTTVSPEAGQTITNVQFAVDGTAVPGSVATTAATVTGKPANTVVATLRAYANSISAVHILSVTAFQSDGAVVTAQGNFEIVPIQQTGFGAKNIIILIGDGMGIGQRTAARIMRNNVVQGKVTAPLAMDLFPYTGLVSVHSLNSMVPDSSAGGAPYATGNKANNNQHGVFPDDTLDKFDNPRIESIGEYLHRTQGRSLGIVTTADIEDSTPGAFGSHTQDRNAGTGICDQFLDEGDATGLTVLMGGGRRWFLPATTFGSERGTSTDYVLPDELATGWGVPKGVLDPNRDLIAEFCSAGFTYVPDRAALSSVAPGTSKLLGLFSFANMSVTKDKIDKRRGAPLPPGGTAVVDVYGFPDQPMLDEMTVKALEILSQNPNGFVAMIEGASIDKMLHLVDADRAVLDTIEFDRAVELCRQFATNHSSDTLVIVTADHECGGMNVIGGSKVTHSVLTNIVANGGYGTNGVRNAVVGTLESAGFPRYTLDADGYPVTTDINYRMLMAESCDPDHFEDWITNPYPIANSSHSIAPKTAWQTNAPPFPSTPVQRDTNGLFFITGHIPDVIATHTATDIAVSAFGKGAERFTGQMDNTDVFFKVMQAALGDGESLPNGQFKLRIESSTTEGGPVIILMSTDLVNWNPIYTNEVPGALEFYRAKRQ